MQSKITAIALLAILLLSVTSVLQYAPQTKAQEETSLQIMLVPEVQRGQNQHLKIFTVDETGNPVNTTGDIRVQIINERGNLVGPKTIYVESGQDISYRVGANTNPQNITVYASLIRDGAEAAQNYWVFPKGQAQLPDTEPVPEPDVPPVIEPPQTNNTEDGEIVVPPNNTDVTEPDTPSENETGEPIPLPPTENETGTGENQTEIPVPLPTPTPDVNVTAGNQTENATIEPTPIPPTEGGEEEQPPTTPGEETPNGTIPTEPETPTGDNATGNQTTGGNQTTEPETPTEPPVFGNETGTAGNMTAGFENLANSTLTLQGTVDEAGDDIDDVEIGQIKEAVGETSLSIGAIGTGVVNATDNELIVLRDANVAAADALEQVIGGNGE